MKTIKITSSLILGLMLISFVSAFGVSSPYWEGNPLHMAKGETKTVNLNLQNMVGEGDVDVKAILVQGSEITSLPKEVYTVKQGTSDTMVPVKISIPKDVSIGETNLVRIEFKTIQDNTKGISMGTGMAVSFDVIATQEVKEADTTTVIALVVGIMLLAIILWLVLKKKKK